MSKFRRNITLIFTFLLVNFFAVANQPIENTQVTIYNNNLGLIKQTRTLELERGISEVRIEEVAAMIEPTSVHIIFVKNKDKVEVLEQNFLYDLVNSSKVFEKYIGETISYRLESGEEVTGILLSFDGSRLIIQLPDSGIKIASTKTILDYEFPSLPEGLILKPTLQWLLDSEAKGTNKAEISYLTRGMGWHAEYVLVLEENETDFALSSWVSLNNNSGATYENAKMKLVAGEIHRAPPPVRLGVVQYQVELDEGMAKAKPFEERELFDYYLYDLQRPVTIKDKEIKQISLFDEVSGKGRKIYTFSNNAYSESDKPLEVSMKIVNSEKNNMGFPLPAGIVRVFKKDIDETLQLIGEDRISHTSKNDTLNINIGKAFDVKGKRVIKNREKPSKTSEDITIEIIIHNRKDEEIEVEVNEFLSGIWYIKNASHKFIKKSNSLLVFPLKIKPNETEKITYTFQRSW
jgi:hypothetical protein